MNRETVLKMLTRAENEPDPVARGLILAEAQVLASLVIIDHLEDIRSQAELIGANTL